MHLRSLKVLLSFLVLGANAETQKARLKDLVSLEGVRDNQLIGYGLVVGLRGTGDRQQTIFSVQSLTNMLQQMGVATAGSIRVQNTAAVMVTATLPPFAQPGSKIDATVAAMGDAASLQGGILLMTGLRAVDGQVYSMVQGPVITGGFIAGRAGNSETVNHPTVGRVPAGATVERAAPSVTPAGGLRLQLKQADFTTAARISEAVNQQFTIDPPIAHADNSGVVSVKIPPKFASRTIEFIAELEKLTVESDRPARVVVNERTGTVVMGKEVKVSPVAIMHGNLVVEIETRYTVSQPGPFASGAKTEVTPQVSTGVKEEKARNLILKEGATVEELVRALGSIGSTPRDIIAILQSLRSAGALEAELDVL